jgi:hypothetical protein
MRVAAFEELFEATGPSRSFLVGRLESSEMLGAVLGAEAGHRAALWNCALESQERTRTAQSVFWSGVRSRAFAAKTCDLVKPVTFGYLSEMNVYITCTLRERRLVGIILLHDLQLRCSRCRYFRAHVRDYVCK